MPLSGRKRPTISVSDYAVAVGIQDGVQRQERREGDAVTIVTGMLPVACLVVIGEVLLAVTRRFAPLPPDLQRGLSYLLLGCAVVLGVRYVYRHRVG